MIKIRRNVFETNSSSTHSITICTKQEYEDWVAGKTYYNDDSWNKLPKFLTPEEVDIYMRRECSDWKGFEDDDAESLLDTYELYSYSYYCDYICEYYETYQEDYKTTSGDEVIAFGYYGHD